MPRLRRPTRSRIVAARPLDMPEHDHAIGWSRALPTCRPRRSAARLVPLGYDNDVVLLPRSMERLSCSMRPKSPRAPRDHNPRGAAGYRRGSARAPLVRPITSTKTSFPLTGWCPHLVDGEQSGLTAVSKPIARPCRDIVVDRAGDPNTGTAHSSWSASAPRKLPSPRR